MKEINIVLKSLSDGLKAIAKSMEAVAKQVDSLATAKPQAKAAKKAPAKKATSPRKPAARKPAARKPAARKPAARKPAARKPASRKSAPKSKVVKKAPARAVKKNSAAKRVTAVDTIFGLISRSKKGVSVGTLKSKTNFNDKKIANIVYKLKKQGKVKSISKGLYVKSWTHPNLF